MFYFAYVNFNISSSVPSLLSVYDLLSLSFQPFYIQRSGKSCYFFSLTNILSMNIHSCKILAFIRSWAVHIERNSIYLAFLHNSFVFLYCVQYVRSSWLMFRANLVDYSIFLYILECWVHEIVCVCSLLQNTTSVLYSHIKQKAFVVVVVVLCVFGMLSICFFFYLFLLLPNISQHPNENCEIPFFLDMPKKQIIAGSKTYLSCVLFCFVACQCRFKIKTNKPNNILIRYILYSIGYRSKQLLTTIMPASRNKLPKFDSLNLAKKRMTMAMKR